MTPIGFNSVAAQAYSGVQRSSTAGVNGAVEAVGRNRPAIDSQSRDSGFKLPQNATPKGDWVLSENANPQAFDANARPGTYLNIVV